MSAPPPVAMTARSLRLKSAIVARSNRRNKDLAFLREDLGYRHARSADDGLIDIKERHLQDFRHAPAHGAFAGAHESGEDDIHRCAPLSRTDMVHVARVIVFHFTQGVAAEFSRMALAISKVTIASARQPADGTALTSERITSAVKGSFVSRLTERSGFMRDDNGFIAAESTIGLRWSCRLEAAGIVGLAIKTARLRVKKFIMHFAADPARHVKTHADFTPFMA